MEKLRKKVKEAKDDRDSFESKYVNLKAKVDELTTTNKAYQERIIEKEMEIQRLKEGGHSGIQIIEK